MFGSLKKIVGAATKEVKAEYGQNKDFLEACCAAVALVAYADGTLEPEEQKKAMQIVGGHATLSKIYSAGDIEKTLETMLKRADSHSGRIALMREIGDVRGKGETIGEDVYLVGLDVAFADGELEAPEVAVLNKIAATLSVDLRKLGLHEMVAGA